jgi:hypothetical protein
MYDIFTLQCKKLIFLKGGRPEKGKTNGDDGEKGVGGAKGGKGTPYQKGAWNTPSDYWGQDGEDGKYLK